MPSELHGGVTSITIALGRWLTGIRSQCLISTFIVLDLKGHFLMKYFLYFSVVATLLATAMIPSASAQSGSFSTDPAAWSSSVPGTAFTDIVDGLEVFDGVTIVDLVISDPNEEVDFLIATNQDLPWGTILYNDDDVMEVRVANTDLRAAVGVNGSLKGFQGDTIEYVVDPALEIVSGFCIRYGTGAAVVRVFDGDNLIATIDAAVGQTVADPDGVHICWENTNGDNVTSFDISYIEGTGVAPAVEIFDTEIRFIPRVPVEESNFESLTEVVDQLEDLADSLDGNDAVLANRAIYLLDYIHEDFFWELPEGERLSRYGSTVFLGSAYAVAYLNRIGTEEARLIAEDIVSVLEQVVDAEIAYAYENGGRTDFIERAEDIADVAEYIDEEFDCDAIASLVYRRAWLFAYCSTNN